ncbi:MAG: flagellar export chaperone FliS [Marinospirillum sp.]|uniref:flagellar export chaperone FliS n=1 Tax=Marinospirillum sp. TaxID=2183934 RepID=UPI0019FC686E|nr:flagellar export chaperone FliS [Marinospirillum sp.]MBE0508501.1 flagellar export chaperone FliS [Marinospirillum sp.]
MVRRLTPYQMKKSAQAWASQVNNNRHLETEVQEADAHKLTQMLYSAIISHLNDGISALDRKDEVSKNKWLNKAQAGITELRVTLRHDIDPELAANLDNLYEYCGRLISKAKASNKADSVIEAVNLLTPIKEAWEEVADEARKFREDLTQYQKEQAIKTQQEPPKP